MNRLLATIFLSVISFSTWATEQMSDVFEGREVPVKLVIQGQTPLQQYFYRSSVKNPFKMMHTANYRGHVASWSIKNDQFFLVRVMVEPEHATLPPPYGTLVEYDFAALSKLKRTEDGIHASWFTGAILLAVGPHRVETETGYYIDYTNFEIMWISAGMLTDSVVLSPEDYRKGFKEYINAEMDAYHNRPSAELSKVGKIVHKYFSKHDSITKKLVEQRNLIPTTPPNFLTGPDSPKLITPSSNQIPYLRIGGRNEYNDPARNYDVDNLVGNPKYVLRGGAKICSRSEKPSNYSLGTKLHFDRQGRLVEVGSNPSSYRREEYIYPENKTRNTEYRRYSKVGEKPDIKKFNRDSAGNITDHKIQAYSDGTFTIVREDSRGAVTEKFDSSGYPISRTRGTGNSRWTAEISYIFDEAGKIRQKKSASISGSSKSSGVDEYNDRGHIVLSKSTTISTVYEDEISIITYNYDYDEQGNWLLKRICDEGDGVSDNVQCFCFPREIEYYD